MGLRSEKLIITEITHLQAIMVVRGRNIYSRKYFNIFNDIILLTETFDIIDSNISNIHF